MKPSIMANQQNNYGNQPKFESQYGASIFIPLKRRKLLEPTSRPISTLNSFSLSPVNNQIIQKNNSYYSAQNLLQLMPHEIKSITYPQIFMPDLQTYVSLKGNFFVIKNNKNQKKYINRKSKPLSELIYIDVQRVQQNIILIAIEKYRLIKQKQQINNKQNEHSDKQCYNFHIYVSIYNQDTEMVEEVSAVEKGYIVSPKTKRIIMLGFKGFQLIEKNKKAFLILEPVECDKNAYEIFLINFQLNEQGLQPKTYESNKCIGRGQLQRKQNEQFIKIINSDFGNIVLIITNQDIYEIEADSSNHNSFLMLELKPFLLSKVFTEIKNTFCFSKNIQQISNNHKRKQLVRDAHYVKRTLRLQILTSHGRIFVLQSQQYLLSQSLYEVLSQKQILEVYNLNNFSFKRIYPLKNLVAIQIQAIRKTERNLLKQTAYQDSILQKLGEKFKVESVTRALLVVKILNNSVQLTKLINLPFEMKEYGHFKIHPFKDFFQLLIQTIKNKNPQTLEIYHCKILSIQNHYFPFIQQNYIIKDNLSKNQSNNIPAHLSISNDVDYIKQDDSTLIISTLICEGHILKSLNSQSLNSQNSNSKNVMPNMNKQSKISKVAFGKTTKSIFILENNQLYGYRLYTGSCIHSLPLGIRRHFTVKFFQHPLKVILHPLTSSIAVLYKQFVKFFFKNFTQLKNYHVLNVRNVCDISYTKSGQYLILAMNDNSIYKLDSYKFVQTKLMTFYGDIREVNYINQKILSVRSQKGCLHVFKLKNNYEEFSLNQKKQNDLYNKLYDVKLNQQSLYYIDEEKVIIIDRNGKIHIYEHNLQETWENSGQDRDNNLRQAGRKANINNNHNNKKNINNNNTKKDTSNISTSFSNTKQLKQALLLLIGPQKHNQHPNLIATKQIPLQKGEYPSVLLFNPQFSIIFIGTTFGNLKQCLYPFEQSQSDLIPCYTYPLTNNRITHLEISASYSELYVITEDNQIYQLQFQQYLNGVLRNAIFTISKTQVIPSELKYQYCHRDYLIDDFTLVDQTMKSTIKQEYEQASLLQDKLKDDIEDITNKIKHISNKQINEFTSALKISDRKFRNQFTKLAEQFKHEEKDIYIKLQDVKIRNNKIKEQQKQLYEKQLLQIYKENDRIKQIKKEKKTHYQVDIDKLKKEFQTVYHDEIGKCEKQAHNLENHYLQIDNKYTSYKKISSEQQKTYENQLACIRVSQLSNFSLQLQQQGEKQEFHLSQISKMQKQIQKYKKRSIHFENMIVESKLQIQQLEDEIKEYQQKKIALNRSLDEKEYIIEDKQKHIINYMKNTSNMKKIKNIHEFELFEFQEQITPIHYKISQMEQQIQKMNFQIEEQFENKMTQASLIETSKIRIDKLKQKRKEYSQKIIEVKRKYHNFLSQLAIILQNPLKTDLSQELNTILNNYLTRNQFSLLNNEADNSKKQGQNIIRRKNNTFKSLQQLQLKQENIIKNKNQFFRHYQQNTNIVNEYNELFKEYNYLTLEKKKLQSKIVDMKNEHLKTPMKKTSSLHFRRTKISEKKLTPFQKYELEHFLQAGEAKKQTADTRASRIDSTIFLKTLMKDVNTSNNGFQKSIAVRNRIRTYVNPELSKNFQRQLFTRQKQRGKSNFLKI